MRTIKLNGGPYHGWLYEVPDSDKRDQVGTGIPGTPDFGCYVYRKQESAFGSLQEDWQFDAPATKELLQERGLSFRISDKEIVVNGQERNPDQPNVSFNRETQCWELHYQGQVIDQRSAGGVQNRLEAEAWVKELIPGEVKLVKVD